jgi:hypothetical protein
MSVLTQNWSMRRAKKRLEHPPAQWNAVIEYVPPQRNGEAGEQSYFWIGDDKGCFATIDALNLAAFVDKVRGA